MVIKATQRSGRAIISLEQPIRSGSAPANSMTVGDSIEDMRVEANPFENVAQRELLERVRSVLNTLSPKEAAILRLRFGLVDTSASSEAYPITNKEINEVMNGKGLR